MEGTFELRDVYADTTPDWEAWQSDYRSGAFYIFPPPGVIEAIDALRQAHDPKSAPICQAHISLSEPLPGPMTNLQMQEVRAALSAAEACAHCASHHRGRVHFH